MNDAYKYHYCMGSTPGNGGCSKNIDFPWLPPRPCPFYFSRGKWEGSCVCYLLNPGF